jgi:hypothetical protein
MLGSREVVVLTAVLPKKPLCWLKVSWAGRLIISPTRPKLPRIPTKISALAISEPLSNKLSAMRGWLSVPRTIKYPGGMGK